MCCDSAVAPKLLSKSVSDGVSPESIRRTDVHLAAKVFGIELCPSLVTLKVHDGFLLDIVSALADDGHGLRGALGTSCRQLIVFPIDCVGADPDIGHGVHDHLGWVVVLGPADLKLQLLLDHVDAGNDLAGEVGVVDTVVDDSVGRFLSLPKRAMLQNVSLRKSAYMIAP